MHTLFMVPRNLLVWDFLEISVIKSFRKLAEKSLSEISEPFCWTEISKAAWSRLSQAIKKKIIERHCSIIGTICIRWAEDPNGIPP